jgi:cytochrome c biogenesis protein CcdA
MPFAWLALVVFLAGALSVLSPCILPVLPFVFGGTGQPFARRAGPMLLGLASAFVVVALAGTAAAAWAAAAATWALAAPNRERICSSAAPSPPPRTPYSLAVARPFDTSS